MKNPVETRPHALLVISCAQRKSADLTSARAWDLYDGRLFQVLKKTLRDRVDWDREILVLIVSAKYGVIRSDRIIDRYELRLTIKDARLLRKRFSDQLRAAVEGHSFRAVRVDLGLAYRNALPDLDALFDPIPVDWATGGIGVRNARTRGWVLEQLGAAGDSFTGETR